MLETITIGGETIKLTAEQSEKIVEILKAKKNPFERNSNGGRYYYIDSGGKVEAASEENSSWAKRRQDNANHCTDKALLEKRALEETLSRLLWRFAEINNEHKPNWKNSNECKCYCYYDCNDREWRTTFNTLCRNEGATYFSSRALAERAIAEIIEPFCKEHPEIVG